MPALDMRSLSSKLRPACILPNSFGSSVSARLTHPLGVTRVPILPEVIRRGGSGFRISAADDTPAGKRSSDKEIEHLQSQIDTLCEMQERLQHALFYGTGEQKFAATAATNWFTQTSDGWVVTLDQAGARRSLPSHLKVSVTGQSSGRDLFTISEGIFAGTEGSIRSDAGLLTATNPHLGAAALRFYNRPGGPVNIGGQQYDKELKITSALGAVQTFPARTDPDNPIANGSHDVQIPDFPHPGGAQYGTCGTVWFRLGTSGDRYLHPGRVSLGCVTCAPQNWPTIYGLLIKARTDTTKVGSLTVAANP